ncbi:MAG: carbohydrate kinase family protein [Candidatus Nanopelagicaceae bacterium]
MTQNHRVLCIGDIALDVIVKLDIDGGRDGFSTLLYGSDTPSKVVTAGGGAAANVAAWLATSDAQPELVCRIGNDSVGLALVDELEGLGVHCHRRDVKDLSTGTVVVLVDRSGERTMFPDSGANAGLTAKDLPPLEGYSAAYISGYALFNKRSHQGVLEIFAQLRDARIPSFFDPASVGTMSTFADRDTILKVLPRSDVMLLNESEARYLAEDHSHELDHIFEKLAPLASTIVIKRNDLGSLAFDSASGVISEDKQERRQPIDSTGAGDSFAAGFIASWIKDRDLPRALQNGNLIAGRCVELIGARPPKSP